MKTNSVPKIRFKGFTDAWEQRKLLNVTESIKNGYTYKADGNREHKYKVTRIESISSGIINVEKLGSSDDINKDYKLIDGDILFSHINSLSHIGNTAMYTADLGEIYHGMNLINIRAKQNIVNSRFLLYLLKKESSRNWFRIIAKPAVNQASISVADVGSFDFLMPNIAEQEKIGEYFSNLDHLITLHQRKCEQTKELKKFMLQKMFPKKGEKNPEIRFPGFTDDWEQRKLGELLNETRNKTTVEDEDTLLSCAIDGMFLNSELFSHFRGSSNIGYLKVKKNDLILSAQNLHLGNCNVNLRFEHGIISPAYKVYELIECNPLFMQAWVKQDKTKDFFLKASTEGASVCRKNIIWEELYKQKLPVPKVIEQQKIGEYFSNLDHLITLHQRKCEQLKELKKFMLQNMFPKKG